jgi:glycosyltransferase involved in cell wall biosynthesis
MNAGLRVRVVIPARNEQARLGALLASVARGQALAERLGAAWHAEVLVVLDRCTDATLQVARRAGVSVLECPAPGGKVEALRAGLSPQFDVHVCIDADVMLGGRTLFDLVETLLDQPQVLAACPPFSPEPLAGWSTPLAWALHRYNAARGFSSERLWLSGRCFALRFVDFPSPAEVRERALRVPPSLRVPALEEPLLADDVWLSRALLARSARAIRHVETDPVLYRAPSTLRGMSRTYRRLRRELRRIDLLFPDLPGPGRDRRVDSLHGLSDRLAFALFQLALLACRAHAQLEEALHSGLQHRLDPWPVVRESKR